MNKVDLMDDEEMLELVDMEVKELLEKYGFDPETTPFVFGSARYYSTCTLTLIELHLFSCFEQSP